MNFFSSIQEAADTFLKAKTPIRVISHYDADGLTSAAIITKALVREEKKFSLSIVKQITPSLINQLNKEEYKTLVFTDLGSGNLSLLNQLQEKQIFVLDHHIIEQDMEFSDFHINPSLFKLEENELSGAGVTYFFCKALNEKNKDTAYLAIIGAIGDLQENNGFSGLNKEILQEASNIEIENGLRFFGSQTRPIHKALEYSTDPFIPEVSGDESKAINFLNELDINPKLENGSWKKLIDLNKEEIKKLTSAIIIKRIANNEKNPENITGPIYLLKTEEQGSALRDLREFSTLLNCCGRLGKSSLGIGTCLNDENSKKLALELLNKYRTELITSLNWFYENKSKFVENDNFVVINAEENIKDSIIGTVTTIISKSNIYNNGKILIAMAHTLDGNTKISARVSGYNPDLNLKEVLSEITAKFNCSAGGHRFAAGSLIPQEKEQEFIDLLIKK